MEKIIKGIYDKKLSDGTFEQIVSNNFEKMINDACSELFKWGGAVRKQMEEKIKGITSSLIDNTDFNNYVVKLQDVINASLKETTLSQYKDIAESVKKLVGVPKIKRGQEVKITELLKGYAKYIETQLYESDFDSDEIDTDDGDKMAYLNCYVEIGSDNNASYFFYNRNRKIITLTHDKAEEHEETVIQFYLEKNYKGNYEVRIDKSYRIRDLRYLPDFILYLIDLEQNDAVIIMDDENATETAEFEFEWK